MENTSPERVKPPMLGLSSSHGPTLLNEYLEAAAAIEVAMKALDTVSPHSRDYPTTGSFALAVKQQQARELALVNVRRELMDLAEAVSDQVGRSHSY